MDTGSARSRLNIYGQRIIWVVYIMKHYNEQFTNYLQLWTLAYYLEMKLFLGSRFDIYYTLSRDADIITGTLLLLDLLYTSYVNRTVSSSDVVISDVCI